MNRDDQEALAHAANDPSRREDVFVQVGNLTRLLHDAVGQLGVLPQLQHAAGGLPDARSRLNYIGTKTAEAAEKVLNSVDQAKADHARMVTAARDLAARLAVDPATAVADGAVQAFAEQMAAASTSIDRHLTDIMLAQDFHDLTGQVVKKVVSLAGDLESSLVKLLVQVAPLERQHKVEQAMELLGPVVNPEGRSDVVANQEQVDDLLASLGF